MNCDVMNNFSVIICAYTQDRWKEMIAALESVRQQSLAPREIILVIDHNHALFERAREAFEGVLVLENSEGQGLSGARNTGITAACCDLLAFMDEDAIASPDWLEQLARTYRDPEVIGAGGSIAPMWIGGRPGWFPPEFDWVVGCTYQGMPDTLSPVRNLIGCNMSFRREIFEEIGGFREGMGRIGTVPLGCEETELCIRARQRWPHSRFVYQPLARVTHRVPAHRAALSYYLSRCYSEGISKALVASLVGSQDGLNTERSYVLRTLPRGIFQGLGLAVFRLRLDGLGRAAAIMLGLTWTVFGYAAAKVELTLNGRERPGHPKTLIFADSRASSEGINLVPAQSGYAQGEPVNSKYSTEVS